MLCYSGCNPRLLAWKNHMCSESQGPVGVDSCGLSEKKHKSGVQKILSDNNAFAVLRASYSQRVAQRV